jgi:hypothetical protein
MTYKKIKNGFKYFKNGWNYVAIWGKPYERGLAHGKLLKSEINEALTTFKWSLLDSNGFDEEFFIEFSNFLFKGKIKDDFPEFFDELKGIADGAGVTVDEIILWNNSSSLDYAIPKLQEFLVNMPKLNKKYGDLINKLPKLGQMEGGSNDKCSAFMALKPYTTDGKIVCSHNSFDNFILGQWFNTMLSIRPDKGHPMLFQTAPGYIASMTDMAVTGKGFIVTETTIGGFLPYEHKLPITCRIREAMQYANTLDDYVKILENGNSGDYANSWLIGDTRNNEIMRIELGLKFVGVERKKEGYFIGFNAPYDPRIRNLECNNSGFDDIRRHQGARKVRLEQLMEKYKGKIDISVGKEIIADHYDVYLNKINPCSRTVCSHYELDNRQFMSQPERPLPYQPRGAVDGTCTSSDLCKNMELWGRWGSSCGTPFFVKPFIDINIQWKRYEPWLLDRPSQPWALFRGHTKITNKNILDKLQQDGEKEEYNMIKNAPYSSKNKAIKIQKRIEKGKLTKKQVNNIIKKQLTSKLIKTKKNKKNKNKKKSIK